jgi:hypothetical protein
MAKESGEMKSAAFLTGMSMYLEFTLLPKGYQTEPGLPG